MDERREWTARALEENPGFARAVMETPDGRELLRLLNRDGDGFRRAVQAAARGDSADLAERLGRIARSGEGAALLSRLRTAAEDGGGRGGV